MFQSCASLTYFSAFQIEWINKSTPKSKCTWLKSLYFLEVRSRVSDDDGGGGDGNGNGDGDRG